MRYTLNAGESSQIAYDFDNVSIDPTPGYPIVTILDQNGSPVSTFPSVKDGANWIATVTIPDVNSQDTTIYLAKWETVNSDNSTIVNSIPIIIEPNVTSQVGNIVILTETTEIKFIVPGVVDSATVSLNAYMFNELIFTAPAVSHTQFFDKTELTVTIPDVSPSLAPYLITIGTTSMFSMWVVTPSILNATNAVESWINKAKVNQVIPQLEYTQSDLLTYLERGLNLFNSFHPQLTSFNGTNMQGVVYEMWLLCTTYYALGAQLQAEGALAFDFGGQAVTLNVDRTASIESALGSIESMMNDRVPQTKRLLAKYGIKSGSGANGNLSGMSPTGLGKLTITSGASTVGNARNYGYSPYRR